MIAALLPAAELDRLLDPATYLGSSQQFIERVLHRYHQQFNQQFSPQSGTDLS